MSLHLIPCPKPLAHTIAAAAAALALAGCGGGSGGGFIPSSASAPAPAVQAPAAPPVEQSQAPAPGPSPSGNNAPVSNAGTAQSTITGKAFKLDGSASSDADGDALTYEWTLVNKPATSTAALASQTDAKPEFIADVAGDYVFSLIVNDGKADSEPTTVTVTVALPTWRDADCSTAEGAMLPACTVDFSDNNASVTVVKDRGTDALLLETRTSTSLATQKSFHTGIKGNRAILGTGMLHEVHLSAFPGISFKSLDDGTGIPNAGAGLPYVTYSISKECKGLVWNNLITNLSDMSRTGPDADGYYTYTADVSATSTAWKSTDSSLSMYATDGTTAVLGPNDANQKGKSLVSLIQAYPDACIYNWPNPDAEVKNATTTPAVMLMLGSSTNITGKKVWFKDIKIGNKTIF